MGVLGGGGGGVGWGGLGIIPFILQASGFRPEKPQDPIINYEPHKPVNPMNPISCTNPANPINPKAREATGPLIGEGLYTPLYTLQTPRAQSDFKTLRRRLGTIFR